MSDEQNISVREPIKLPLITNEQLQQAKSSLPREGDVFQIIEAHGRKGWIGAFVLATEIKSWGIQGFVSHVVTHEEQSRAFIRLKWEEIEFIGQAVLIPDRGEAV